MIASNTNTNINVNNTVDRTKLYSIDNVVIKANEDWNKTIEDVLYIKTIVLACNGRAYSIEDNVDYEIGMSTTSNELREGHKDKLRLITEDCRRVFNAPVGEFNYDGFKPLYYKQSVITDNNTQDGIRVLTYHNSFELVKDNPISVLCLDETWSQELWLSLFPRSMDQIGVLDRRTINNLIAIFTECIRSTMVVCKKTINDEQQLPNGNAKNMIKGIWKALDDAVDTIIKYVSIEDLNRGIDIHMCNDEVYYSLSLLLAGSIEFYIKTLQPIPTVLIGNGTRDLYWCFNNHLNRRHQHEVSIVVHNFIKDLIGLPIKLTLTYGDIDVESLSPIKKLLLPQLDTYKSFVSKIFELIMNHSDKNNWSKKFRLIRDLLTTVTRVDKNIFKPDSYEDTIEDPNEPLDDYEIKALLKGLPLKQRTLKSVVAMHILLELYYSDKIIVRERKPVTYRTNRGKTITKLEKYNKNALYNNNVIGLYENLINDAVDILVRDHFVGSRLSCLRPILVFFQMIPCNVKEVEPYIRHQFIPMKYHKRHMSNNHFYRTKFDNVMRTHTIINSNTNSNVHSRF